MNKFGSLVLVSILLLLIFGCTAKSVTPSKDSGNYSPTTAWRMIDEGAQLVDVRTPEEYAGGHIDGSINIPHNEIANRIAELDAERPVVVYCRSGRRSSLAEEYLKAAGFKTVVNGGGYDEMLKAKM